MNYTSIEQIPLVLSVKQLADILGVSRNTAYGFVKSGRIKSVHVGHKIRISRIALLEFLDMQ